MGIEFIRFRKQHESEPAVIAKHDACPFIRFEYHVIVFAGGHHLALAVDSKSSGHSQVHDQCFASIEIEKQVLRAPSQNLNLASGHTAGEVPGQRNTQVSASGLDANNAMAGQQRRKAAANGFDFRKFGHVFSVALVYGFQIKRTSNPWDTATGSTGGSECEDEACFKALAL
jgi:hypothetical protein